MDKNKILKALDRYEKILTDKKASAKKMSSYTYPSNSHQALDHVLYMISKIRDLLDQDKIEKAMRWFGFIQAIMWRDAKLSLEELKSDNR